MAGRDVLVPHGQRGGEHGGGPFRHGGQGPADADGEVDGRGAGGGDALGGRGDVGAAVGGQRHAQRARHPQRGRAPHHEPADGVDERVDVVDGDRADGRQRGLVDEHDPAVDPVDRAGQHGSSLNAPRRWSGPASRRDLWRTCDAGYQGGSSVGGRVARRRPSGRPVSGSGPAGLLRARGRDRARHRGRRGRRAAAGRLAARAGRRAARRAAAGARLRLQPLAVEDHLAAAGAGAGRRPGGGAAGPHHRRRGGVGGRAAGPRRRPARRARRGSRGGRGPRRVAGHARPDRRAGPLRGPRRPVPAGPPAHRLGRGRRRRVRRSRGPGCRGAGRAAMGLPRPLGDPPPAAGRRGAGAVRGRAAGGRHDARRRARGERRPRRRPGDRRSAPRRVARSAVRLRPAAAGAGLVGAGARARDGACRPTTVAGAVFDSGHGYPAWLPDAPGVTPGVVVPVRDPAELLPTAGRLRGPGVRARPGGGGRSRQPCAGPTPGAATGRGWWRCRVAGPRGENGDSPSRERGLAVARTGTRRRENGELAVARTGTRRQAPAAAGVAAAGSSGMR